MHLDQLVPERYVFPINLYNQILPIHLLFRIMEVFMFVKEQTLVSSLKLIPEGMHYLGRGKACNF